MVTRILDERTVVTMDREKWITQCAYWLQRQWRTVDPEFLCEVAGDLWRDERLREMAPDVAAVVWLRPVTERPPMH